MQKNIVLGVNAAMAAQSHAAKDKPVNPVRSEDFIALKEDIASLKEENSLFAAAVEEMRQQNEELKSKIEKLISSAATPKKTKKKKKSAKNAR